VQTPSYGENRVRTSWICGIVLASALPLVFSASSGIAQTSKGSIGGTITDTSDAVVTGATITARNNDTGEVRTTTTGANGQYRIDAVEPGSYAVTITQKGFTPLTLEKITVSGSVVTSVNVKLMIGVTTQTIVVQASNAVVQTENGELSQTIGTAEVQDIPYDSLNPYALSTTLPGVSTVTSGLTFTNGTTSEYSSEGTRPRGNNFLIEGQDNNDAEIHGQGLQPENLQAIQEVTILLNSTSAEYGHGGGAIANLIYRSGTNSFHGAAWDRLSNSSLDATDHANVIAGIPKSKYRENIFGFNLGGPVKKDKLFFFTSYQWDNYRSSANGGVLTLPSAAGFTVLQKYASNPRIAAMLTAYGSLRGDPTRSGAPAPIPLGQDRGSVEVGLFNRTGVPQEFNQPEFDAKGDYIITRNDTLNMRYIRSSFSTPYDFFHFPNNLPGFDSDQSGVWQNAGLTYTHIFSPTLLNEVRISYGRMGLSFLPRADNVPAASGPTINLSNEIQGWGANPLVPQGRFHDTYQVQDSVSWTKGKHFIKIGVDFADIRARDAIPYNFFGQVIYAPGGGYHALANYLDDYSGGTASVSQTFGSPIVHASLPSQNYFFQDSWKARPNLTLDFGLRYEYNGAPANQLKYPAIDYSNLGCFPCVIKQKGDKEDFGPRFSFAYTPNFWKKSLGDGKTVVRGGFGVFYDGLFTDILDGTQAASPNSVASAVSVAGNGRGKANWSTYFSQLPTSPNAKATENSQVAHLLSPEILQWNFNIQRELPGMFTMEIGYVGTRGEHLFANTSANSFLPNGKRLNPARGSITVRDNSGDSIYHGLQVQVARKFSRGFLFRSSYTFSKMIDDSSEIFTPGLSQNDVRSTWSSVPAVQYPSPRGTDRSVSAFDHKQRWTFTYVYDIPKLKSKDSLTRGAGYLVNGWQISGTTAFQSGTPYNVNTGFDSNGDGVNNDRPSLGNPHAPLATYAFTGDWAGLSPNILCDGPTLWFFNQCTPVSSSQVHWFVPSNGQGNVGRNSLIGPWYISWAFSMTRNITVHESQALQIRMDLFNPFNQTHKDGDGYWPNMQLVSGIVPAGSGASSTFADFSTSLHGGRTVRMLLKYSF
jgi:Carboxypeptidase regulatory-like domain